ncbi:MAG TPA: hypothetical protein VGG25_08885 [Streptosporangiaceae bacterium]|jgi:uncharacterized membrane protein
MRATGSGLVETYLRRLDAALAGLPAARRQEITEGIAQHIAEARQQLGGDGQDTDDAIHGILRQFGDPDAIAAEALDTERGPATAEEPPRSAGTWSAPATHATLVQAAAVNLVGAVLWLLMARWNPKGNMTARTLACVLLGLRTVAVLIGPGELSALSPWPTAVRALTAVGWLVGLGAIALLWQRSSNAFIKARFPL